MSDEHSAADATQAAAHGNASPPPGKIPEDLEADFAPLQTKGMDEDDPFHRDSLQAQQAFDEAAKLAADGKTEEAVHRFLTASKLGEVAREWYLAALAFRRVGDFLVHPKPPSDLDRALRMYRRAIDAYQRCGHMDEARELSYAVLYFQMVRGRELKQSWHRRFELRLYWAVAGFGLRPLRVIFIGAVLILLFGLAYWLLGGVVVAATREPASLGECIYFSGITFSTVGYGDFVPAPIARPLAMFEGALGALSIGFFVAVLINRLRR